MADVVCADDSRFSTRRLCRNASRPDTFERRRVLNAPAPSVPTERSSGARFTGYLTAAAEDWPNSAIGLLISHIRFDLPGKWPTEEEGAHTGHDYKLR